MNKSNNLNLVVTEPDTTVCVPNDLCLITLFNNSAKNVRDVQEKSYSNSSGSVIEKVKVIHGRQQVSRCNIAKCSTQSDAAMRNFMRFPSRDRGTLRCLGFLSSSGPPRQEVQTETQLSRPRPSQ